MRLVITLAISLVTVLLVPSTVLAQGTISGRVVGPTEEPVAGATVIIVGRPSRATTDATGAFRLTSVPAGPHVVRVTAVGFDVAQREVEVSVDVPATVTVRMVRSATRLGAVVIREQAEPGSVRPAPDIAGTLVLAGVKTELLTMTSMNANMAEKVPRQIFAKIPGIFVYDMDGSGNQVNISTRGLDAHRSWEMNVRQDGVLLNSDIYGYPASHYSPPMEAMERLELIRGTAGLQYGSQFGGLVNYVTKVPDTTRAASFESISSAGSFGLLSTFNSAGGRVGRLTWSGYVGARQSDGYRDNSESTSLSQFLSGTFTVSPALTLRAQVGRSVYRYQIPGPLTDAMFESDPTQATRERNWFSPDIYVPSLLATWKPDESTTVTAQLSAVKGQRGSVQFVGFADVDDTGAPRQVDIDRFNSLTGELRVSRRYQLGGRESALAAGLTFSDNDLHRRQQGRGTTAGDWDLSLSSGTFGRDIHYKTTNVALYAENLFRITDAWSLIPGVRVENGVTHMTGTLAYYDPAGVPTDIEHKFPLFGIRTEFRAGLTEFYGGWSQSYRPMILADVLPASAIERTDPDLEDARGWTLEAGARGSLGGRLTYDVSLFNLRYNNRFGVLLLTEGTESFLLKTNVGSSDTRGAEVSLEAPLVSSASLSLRAHTATSWFSGKYRSGSIVVNGANVDLEGKRVESVPTWISRTGLTARTGRMSATVLLSYTSESYADPQNTEAPTANGARGLVPSYAIVDLNASFDVTDGLRIRGGVGNLLDRSYFTKRPAFYPGPGVWPSDGRNVQLTVEIRR